MNFKSSIIHLRSYRILYYFLLVPILCAGCLEIQTNKPSKAYENWANQVPPENVEVINGKYWQSAHWTLEYMAYLEIKTDSVWVNKLLENSKYVVSEKAIRFSSDKPEWFNPPKSYQVYVSDRRNIDSAFFVSTDKRHIFIFDIQI